MTNPFRRALCLTISLVSLLTLTVGAHGADEDRWYVLQLQGKRTGYMHSVQKTEGGKIRSVGETSISIKRGEIGIDLTMNTEFIETADGKPVSMKLVKKFGTLATTEQTLFGETEMTITTSQGDQTDTVKRPLPKESWLTPAAADRYVESELAKGAKKIVARTIDPAAGREPVQFTREVQERTTTEAMGRIVPAVKWKVLVDKYPGIESIEYVDEQGRSVRNETDMGGMKIVQLLADKELALSKLEAPEIMMATLVKPDKQIDSPRSLSVGRFELSVPEAVGGVGVPDLPSAGGQKAERVDATTVRVTVSKEGRSKAPVADTKDPALMQASQMLNWKDPEITKLLAKAGEKAKESGKPTAEELRRFVNRFIKAKDMSVGFATASETARTATGDCTEHGVLLAALLRASGIPSRVASGLVYVSELGEGGGLFGYHMWTQALLPGKDGPEWVDLDATLRESSFDGAHILLGVSALSDDQTENMLVTTAPLLGRLRIKVLEAK